jgi:hypothetical protein
MAKQKEIDMTLYKNREHPIYINKYLRLCLIYYNEDVTPEMDQNLKPDLDQLVDETMEECKKLYDMVMQSADKKRLFGIVHKNRLNKGSEYLDELEKKEIITDLERQYITANRYLRKEYREEAQEKYGRTPTASLSNVGRHSVNYISLCSKKVIKRVSFKEDLTQILEFDKNKPTNSIQTETTQPSSPSAQKLTGKPKGSLDKE